MQSSQEKLPYLQINNRRSCSMANSNPAFKKLKDTLIVENQSSRSYLNRKQGDILDSILEDANLIINNKLLEQNVYKLKELGVLKQYDPTVAVQSGLKKSNYVLNDYHSKSTTNGYSRNYGGLFYNR
ncbi:unnamed protein product (macronuclear) [Paramecium tetraurelia]|uniref:Uncharacterized protein n=1 Tax=Paramecium tetraurelia TaxID=5888 RepID=A0E695_PARTE|nr:uncharacterized protein GSPATT00003677001 [Paramecium tetraurelia]CAK90812.1 unnamed protein product [Paramecium tetraurelia]|eukprot:XP_001458209.1 hypothetical protein (macronuclear) [Paramecium tetraurelia strain d4-2]